MVTSSIIRIRCLLHKSDRIWIWSREDGSPSIREYSKPWKLELVAWWTHGNLQENPKYDGSLMWNLWRCVETYTSSNGSQPADCGFQDTLDWQGKESGQQARTSVLIVPTHVCLPARCWNLTSASCTSEFQISCEWGYMWILTWNHKRNGW